MVHISTILYDANRVSRYPARVPYQCKPHVTLFCYVLQSTALCRTGIVQHMMDWDKTTHDLLNFNFSIQNELELLSTLPFRSLLGILRTNLPTGGSRSYTEVNRRTIALPFWVRYKPIFYIFFLQKNTKTYLK